jgi:branched-subunit amino acid ABC-type transport system permease component
VNLLEIVFSWFYQYIDSITVLSLAAVGLVVIFGVMGVINMAHGEMIMVGAYVTSICYYKGVPVVVAVPLAGLVAAAFGVVLERFIIRRFYGQLLSSMVVTWGISIAMSQAALLAFGPQMRSVPTPFGSFSVGELSYSYYRVFLFAMVLLMLVALWLILMRTRFGLHSRATMESPQMARALGVYTPRIYSLTFGLAGIAGGLLAQTSAIGPFLGQAYTPQAFITVVVGGSADILVGLVASVLSLGAVKSIFTNQFNILFGQVALLLAAFFIIRLMPSGISNWIEQRRVSVRATSR